MKKICPACKTLQEAIGFHLSDKELLNLRQLGLSEHLCKPCYNQKLTTLATTTKSELIPLNEQKEITKAAYYEAYDAWKAKAAVFQLIDYNINMLSFETAKKERSTSKTNKLKEPSNIELLAKKILSNLSIEQQEAIIKTFQSQQQNARA